MSKPKKNTIPLQKRTLRVPMLLDNNIGFDSIHRRPMFTSLCHVRNKAFVQSSRLLMVVWDVEGFWPVLPSLCHVRNKTFREKTLDLFMIMYDSRKCVWMSPKMDRTLSYLYSQTLCHICPPHKTNEFLFSFALTNASYLLPTYQNSWSGLRGRFTMH